MSRPNSIRPSADHEQPAVERRGLSLAAPRRGARSPPRPGRRPSRGRARPDAGARVLRGSTASSSRTLTLIGADGVRARGCSAGAPGRRTAPPSVPCSANSMIAADHQLRLLGRREADEPAVVLAVGILRRAGLAGHGQVGVPAGRGGAPLHHGDERAPQPVELLGGEAERPRLGAGRAARCTASAALPSPARPS